MHPNGQLPAYEWSFDDVNPPVFAWAAWRVYKIDQEQTSCADRVFLESIFHKLLLNFTWWVNRKDYELHVDGVAHTVRYEPAESRTGLFGGNSNWRGPIWFPINYLLIESLQKFYYYYGNDFLIECPTGSGKFLNLLEIANELSQRLIRLFVRDDGGRRPFNGNNELLQHDPSWREHVLFHEFFHGEHGKGLGASHQTGWTGLVALLIQQQGLQENGGDEENISQTAFLRAPTGLHKLPERG